MSIYPPFHDIRSVLGFLLAQARAYPGRTASSYLFNNLKVDVQVKGDKVLLAISRSAAWPVDSDWYAVLRHWPYPVHAWPERHRAGGRRYLRASLIAQAPATPQ